MVIIHPLRPRIVAGVVLAVIFAIWLLSVAIALPSLIFANTLIVEYREGPQRVLCFLDWPDGPHGTYDFWCVSQSRVIPLFDY